MTSHLCCRCPLTLSAGRREKELRVLQVWQLLLVTLYTSNCHWRVQSQDQVITLSRNTQHDELCRTVQRDDLCLVQLCVVPGSGSDSGLQCPPHTTSAVQIDTARHCQLPDSSVQLNCKNSRYLINTITTFRDVTSIYRTETCKGRMRNMYETGDLILPAP